MEFAQSLTKIMDERGLTAYRLSKETGISDSLLGYYRSGAKDPSSKNLTKIADYLGVSIDYLVGRTDKPEVNK
jgi:transcriptional regulator with XRE-family HTH domain